MPASELQDRPAENAATDPTALLARARDILAGRIVPPPIKPPPGLLESLDREFGWRVPPPTPEAIRFLCDEAGLDYKYRGEIVAVCKSADGGQAVLAVGEHELRTLLDGLTDDERSRVCTVVTEYGMRM